MEKLLKRYRCPTCGLWSFDRATVEAHLPSHVTKKVGVDYGCPSPICGYYFPTAKEAREHCNEYWVCLLCDSKKDSRMAAQICCEEKKIARVQIGSIGEKVYRERVKVKK